jgi:hypothetical protein
MEGAVFETETTLAFTPGSRQYFEDFEAFDWTWYRFRSCLFRISHAYIRFS